MYASRVIIYCFSFIMAVLYFCCISNGLYAEEALLNKDAYRLQMDKIKNVCNNMTMEVLEEVYHLPKEDIFPNPNASSDLVLDSFKEYKFYVRDNIYFRVDITLHDSKKAIVQDNVLILNPKEAFNFQRMPGKEFYLEGHTNTTDVLVNKKNEFLFTNASCYFLGKSLFFHLFEREDAKITDETIIKDSDNNDLVVLKQTVHNESGQGEFVCRLLKNKGWVVKDIEAVSRFQDKKSGKTYNRVISQKCEYGDETDGIPIIKKVIIENSLGIGEATPQLIEKKIYSITKVIPSPPDISVFDTDKFLPDKIGKPVGFSVFRIFLILSGIILIFFGLYFRRRKST